jgi:hypothetical protein
MPQTYLVVVEPITPGYPPPSVMPPIYYPPSQPPGIWGGGNQPWPTPPIAPGGPPPGVWPQPPGGGHPAHPIAPGGHPSHPIAPGGPGVGGQPPGIWGGPPNWVDATPPGNQPGIDNTLPRPPIYAPGGGNVMPPMAPGGEPTHPIVIPPGSWIYIDNSLPDSGNTPSNELPPTPEPKG